MSHLKNRNNGTGREGPLISSLFAYSHCMMAATSNSQVHQHVANICHVSAVQAYTLQHMTNIC